MSHLVKGFLRFRLRTMLLAITLTAIAIWWERWPFATARHFVEGTENFISERQQPSGYLFREGDLEGFRAMVVKSENEVFLTNHSRSLYDIALGRCTFTAQGKNGSFFRFRVERGAIIKGPTPIYYYGGRELILDVF